MYAYICTRLTCIQAYLHTWHLAERRKNLILIQLLIAWLRYGIFAPKNFKHILHSHNLCFSGAFRLIQISFCRFVCFRPPRLLTSVSGLLYVSSFFSMFGWHSFLMLLLDDEGVILYTLQNK